MVRLLRITILSSIVRIDRCNLLIIL